MKKRREKVALSGSKLAAYATAAVASAVAVSNEAEAGIIYSGPLNITLLDTTTDGNFETPVSLPFAGGASMSFTHGVGATNAATGYALAAGFNASFAGFTAGTFNYVSNLAAGNPVSAVGGWIANSIGTMAFNAGFTNSQFLNPGIGFVGVRFNGNQYGWVRVNMSGGPLNSFTIIDYAFSDTPGEAINVGQISAVPEPSSLAALALGAAAVVGWRRLRKKPDASETAA